MACALNYSSSKGLNSFHLTFPGSSSMKNVFRKLGVSSRAELAALAARRGLS